MRGPARRSCARSDTATALAALPLRWLATLPDEWILEVPDRDAVGGRPAGQDGAAVFASLPDGAGACRAEDRGRGNRPNAVAAGSESGPRSALSRICWPRSRAGGCARSAMSRGCRAPTCTRGSGRPACGCIRRRAAKTSRVLVPADERARVSSIAWCSTGRSTALEPLSFVLARHARRVVGRARARRSRRGRGHDAAAARHARAARRACCNLPAPMRDARTLRTLILLDLESHPPPAGIDIVEIELDVVPGRIVQGSLLTRDAADAGRSGDAHRRGLARSWANRASARRAASTRTTIASSRSRNLRPRRGRRLRPAASPDSGTSGRAPDQARVCAAFVSRSPRACTVEHGAPVARGAVACGLAAGDVVACAGPWRIVRRLVERSTARRGIATNGTWSSPAAIATGSRAIARRAAGKSRESSINREFGELRNSALKRSIRPTPQFPTSQFPNRHVLRTSHLVGVFVSRWRVAARDAHRARGRAGLSGGGAARSRRRVRRAAVLSRREGRRHQGDRRRGADDWREPSRHDRSNSRPQGARLAAGSLPGPRRRPRRGLSESLPRHHAREAESAERASRISTLEDFAATPRDSIALAGRQALRAERHGVGGLVGQLVGVFGRANVWIELQRHFRRDEQARAAVADRSGGRVSRAGHGVQRRAVRDAGGASALRRPHLHSAQDDAGARRGGG